MKQNISIEQLNELSDKGKEKLRKWWIPKDGDISIDPLWTGEQFWSVDSDKDALPLLSIGQMYEFLLDNGETYFEASSRYDIENLCDSLWKEVRWQLRDSV